MNTTTETIINAQLVYEYATTYIYINSLFSDKSYLNALIKVLTLLLLLLFVVDRYCPVQILQLEHF